jgi:predicted CopG family antitoxin
MRKHITVTDEVYERLNREKGDRGFSEIIDERLASDGKLTDITGQQLLDPSTFKEV